MPPSNRRISITETKSCKGADRKRLLPATPLQVSGSSARVRPLSGVSKPARKSHQPKLAKKNKVTELQLEQLALDVALKKVQLYKELLSLGADASSALSLNVQDIKVPAETTSRPAPAVANVENESAALSTSFFNRLCTALQQGEDDRSKENSPEELSSPTQGNCEDAELFASMSKDGRKHLSSLSENTMFERCVQVLKKKTQAVVLVQFLNMLKDMDRELSAAQKREIDFPEDVEQFLWDALNVKQRSKFSRGVHAFKKCRALINMSRALHRDPRLQPMFHKFHEECPQIFQNSVPVDPPAHPDDEVSNVLRSLGVIHNV